MSGPPTAEEAAAVASRFAAGERIVSLLPHAGGLINHSWSLVLAGPAGERRLLLQRINREVFRRPALVMENVERVTRQVTEALAREGAPDRGRRALQLAPTREGGNCHLDARGETWRAVRWIENTRSLDRARSEEEAYRTAFAFGRFLRQLQDLPPPPLHQTIPGFHDTPSRLTAFEAALARDAAARAGAVRAESEALLDRRPLARALANPAAAGAIAERPVHNDAKIANVLFDQRSGEALCVVDLDTVMPGLALHDFGDLVRSAVSDSDEDDRDLSRVRVRPAFFRALERGFVAGAGEALSEAELSLLATGALVITYEQALRFLTDYLEGDRYYRTSRPGHNLDRTRTQLALLESLENDL